LSLRGIPLARDDEAISLISRDGLVTPPSAGLHAMTWLDDIFTMIWSYLSRPRRF